jgi:hypothetical protein
VSCLRILLDLGRLVLSGVRRNRDCHPGSDPASPQQVSGLDERDADALSQAACADVVSGTGNPAEWDLSLPLLHERLLAPQCHGAPCTQFT